jgi:bacteriocin leader peptide (microcyclamide/patellamide family)
LRATRFRYITNVVPVGFFSRKKGTDPPQRVNKPNNKKRIILMDKKNILPHQGKPVLRTTNGKLPSHLAELSEEALGGAGMDASFFPCSYDDGDA